MKTDDLIKALAADTMQGKPQLRTVWWVALVGASLVAGAVFFGTLGFRPDIAHASQTSRFLFKFVVTLALATGAFGATRALSRPGSSWRDVSVSLLVAPGILAIAVIFELFLLPSDGWRAAAFGSNSTICLTYIPLIGLGPLVIFLSVLRYGAPTRPGLAGGTAGLLAGAIAATFYAAQCNDDSPLFVAIWYPLAIAILTGTGALIGKWTGRW
ncbi:DUF1109 family protein [Mesorhizobium sp. NBSH29]|uniref:NrsF family protein n=1 Tax=Mesorhizobium sp. NBSH29 TaxID=2654249 RepID=UPI0018967E05|nr:NrsF family protein [Mesorhizobium sp. NBSH29]QPC87316.1 DUF1109 family protein [Mesorhizobium sp. NBSH29]